jgi:hypothetical protein
VSRVVLVTAQWGESQGEPAAVLRLVAGALSTRAEVEVVALGTAGGSRTTAGPVRTRLDSVFVVHDVPATRADPALAAVVRAALERSGSGRFPDIAGPRLAELAGGRAQGLPEQIAVLGPDTVVLAGLETWWLPDALRMPGGGTRVVSLPLLGDDAMGGLPQLRALLTEVDAVGVLSRGDTRHLPTAPAAPGPGPGSAPEVIELDVAFAVHRNAAESQIAEMGDFGPYVVLLTGSPPGSPGAVRSPGHDYVRRALGPIAVAEVAAHRWSVSSPGKALEMPAGSRTNLWRLLRHAEICIDLRPQGIVARETLESLLLGTPVVVPEGTVAAEWAERSNGGLWYRDYRELFDAAKAILDHPSLRARLGRQGREWARMVHGNQGRFEDQVAQLVLR